MKILAFCFLFAAISLTGTPVRAAGPDHGEARHGQIIARAQAGVGESAMIGSYALRVYRGTLDSFVTGLVAARDGEIAGLWLVDLDHDGWLEVLVWNRSGGSGGYGYLDHFRFDGQSLAPEDLPQAAPEMLTQYMGHDEFAVSDGELSRSFPLYNRGDPNSTPTGGRRTLVYQARERQWVVAP